MPESMTPLIILGVVGALFILLLSLLTNNYSLNNIKSKTVGDGQYGTARWATTQEIRKAYVTVPFDVAAWRAGKKRPTVQGLVLGSVQRGKRLEALVDRDDVHCLMIGASGVGKTAVASIIAAGSGMQLHKLNGTTASTSDIKSVLADIGTLGASGGILLYLDEIQYFNKRQQQSLLECVEQGTVTLIASTTENPYFYVYNALLSRCTVFEFKSLTTDDIRTGLRSAAARLGAEDKSPVLIPDDALEYLAQSAGGDMRKALGNLEFAVTAAPVENGCRTITLDMVQQVAVRTAMRYDKLGDDHYDIVSAYQKSMRGSDPDAALHYLGRLLEAGDLPSACRRLMVCACEDVGLAWPQIIPIVKAAVDIANAVGLPEARLPLADAVVLVATAPKSNSAHDGINAAIADIQAGRTGPIPRQLQNKHYDGADAKVKGQHYLYPHDYPNHWTAQQYLPDAIKDRQYYVPGDNKNEQAFAQYWKKIKGEL